MTGVVFSSPALLEKPGSPGSPATSPVMDTHLVPSSPLFPPSCPGTPPAQDDSWRQAGPRSAAANMKTSPAGVLPLIHIIFGMGGRKLLMQRLF